MLQQRKDIDHWKAKHIDLSFMLHNPAVPMRFGRRCQIPQDHGLEQALDYQLIERAKVAIEQGERVEFHLPIRNVHRTVGAMLSGEISRHYGSSGLPDDTIRISFKGSAGQSFGAFLAKGITLTLEGDANDYVGKGLSGGKIIVHPPKNSNRVPEDNMVVGNVVLYGATSGEVYFNGKAGHRFAIRNSGATAVVEAVGDHGCEYMTNGLVVVLGETGRNFAAGMSGGVVFVLDEFGKFSKLMCNRTSVDLEALDAHDEEKLRELVTNHFELTGSPRAKSILDDWATKVGRFVKVFPHDYKRVLAGAKVPHVIRKAAVNAAKEVVVG